MPLMFINYKLLPLNFLKIPWLKVFNLNSDIYKYIHLNFLRSPFSHDVSFANAHILSLYAEYCKAFWSNRIRLGDGLKLVFLP